MANTRYNSGAVKIRGGKTVAVQRVDDNGNTIANEYFFDLGAKSNTDIDITRPKSGIPDEAGDPVDYDKEPWKAEVKITLMQTDSQTLNFFLRETGDQNFRLLSHCGMGSGTATEYFAVPFGEFDEGVKVNLKDRKLEVTFRPKIPNFAWNFNSLSATQHSTTAWNANFGINSPASLSSALSGNGSHIGIFGEV